MKSIFKLGQVQRLQIVKHVPMGAYLSLPDTFRESDEPKELILLPKKELPENSSPGDLADVFIYKDSEDRPIATTFIPPLTLGGITTLKVVQATKIGAFL